MGRYLFSFVLLTLLLGAGCAREQEAVPNVRLGMTPRDVRDRFHPGGEGSWHTALGTGDDTTLQWRARDAGSPVAHVQFEFHLGMLVAIRARLNESVSGERVTTTPKSVTVREAVPEGGASVIVLARDCPTHKDEADALASRAH